MASEARDERFDRLRERLASPDPADDAEVSAVEAAVALVFRARDDMEMLLVRRAHSERDPWSGHMALPGGKRDPTDRTPLETAIRETFEETGVRMHPAAALGRLPTVTPASRRVPDLSVTPYVFGVPGEVRATVASPEIDAYYWVKLPELRDPANRAHVTIPRVDPARKFPAFIVQGQVVWGLTYRILSGFLEEVAPISSGLPPTRR